MKKRTTIQSMIQSLRCSGLTQCELADLVGVNQSTISRLENGVMVGISYETGRRIWDAYSIRVRA